MKKLGTIDLEILELAIKENGTFNENNLENSELKRLGVGKILDSLASLKDRKFISLNMDGSFSITDIAREILWSNSIPTWVKILRLLQIKSCGMEQICDTIKIVKKEAEEELEKLRKNQFVLMSPQRQDGKIIKIYEILPEGIDKIDKTEEGGFNTEETKTGIDITNILDNIVKDVNNLQIEKSEKLNIIEKLFEIKNKLKI
ncbi:MAG: hypothetical protein MAG458_01179 [Nitrosopumilus sp.]|nr:hypothetical protein [Nitrosopumilus sp.]